MIGCCLTPCFGARLFIPIHTFGYIWHPFLVCKASTTYRFFGPLQPPFVEDLGPIPQVSSSQ